MIGRWGTEFSRPWVRYSEHQMESSGDDDGHGDGVDDDGEYDGDHADGVLHGRRKLSPNP